VVSELGGVVVRQVDLVRDTFEGELNCRNVLSFLASEVIDECDDGLLSHGYGFSLSEGTRHRHNCRVMNADRDKIHNASAMLTCGMPKVLPPPAAQQKSSSGEAA
jgi:hypothetical protein